MSDVEFRGFCCLNPDCQNWLFVRKDSLEDDFEIKCKKCGFVHRSGDESMFYSYELKSAKHAKAIEKGTFGILVDDYLAEAGSYKFCIVCCTIKPFAFFDNHKSRVTKRQGECRLCKKVYNSIKNQTRTTDQHREASHKRRLYLDVTESSKVKSAVVYRRFGYKCFKCEKDLRNVKSERERPLDHTLPVSFLWPLTTDNATLLCREHNGDKSGKWPNEFYTTAELKRLAVKTGIPVEVLSAKPHYNPAALKQLSKKTFVTGLLEKQASDMDVLISLRNRILEDTGLDFFKAAGASLSADWLKTADALLP
jgi:hypothetical protein